MSPIDRALANLRELPGFKMKSEAELRRVVLAVLEGVREPSEGMEEAGENGEEGLDVYWGYYADGRPFGAGWVFTAMIDHLIRETP